MPRPSLPIDLSLAPPSQARHPATPPPEGEGRGGGLPLFLRISRAITDAVARGRLRPGQRLPGSRSLASELGVHRNTVLAAYAELTAEGWISSQAGRGTYVAADLPDARERRAATAAAGPTTGTATATAARAAFPLRLPPRTNRAAKGAGRARTSRAGPVPEAASRAAAAHPRAAPAGVLDLSRGIPDLRLVPADALARAYRRAVRRPGRRLLDYGDPRGAEPLRSALAEMLRATRAVPVGAEGLLVTRGSQMALHLVARALIRPGESVAVEAFGYPPAWRTLRGAGARLVPIPVDAEGLRVDRLAAACARRPIRAVYVTPHHQYPTMAVLSPARRLELLALARARRFAVIEDDYDNEFHYHGRPVLPLASADSAGSVIYLGSLSKILAPAVRAGYLTGPAPLLDRLAELRADVDGAGDPALEHALAELIADGDLARHARRMRRIYQARRAALAAALRARLSDTVSFCLPAGGMALWVDTDPAIDLDAWAARCLSAGVRIAPAHHFAFDRRPRPHLRLAFAARTEAELTRAVEIIAAAR